MDLKLKNLVEMIDFKMFEAMVLLNQSYYSNNVISSDVSLTGNEKYYELWDEYEEKLTLLVISNDENFSENEAVISSNDGYDEYIFAYPCEEQRLEMLCRFYVSFKYRY